PAASEEPAAGAGHENGAPHGMGASSEVMAVYNAELVYRIRRNWAFPAHLADGRPDIEGTINFRILRSGEIRDIVLKKKSGNAYLDDSVMRAVQKSNPLKPLPKAYLDPYCDMGWNFNEKGLTDRRGTYK
ncbi:MAG: TonB C-terminal domain-containing protein, partial [Desulfobacterales bacterium]|nr:TonB C-terminal domain-containing protein [Desulfobacterales bacterium]